MDDGTRTHDDWNHNPGLYQLSYTHHKTVKNCSLPVLKIGAPDRNRTCNRRLRRPVLYPVELRAPILHEQVSRSAPLKMVGVERFELPTSCSQSRRATRLRYTPITLCLFRASPYPAKLCDDTCCFRKGQLSCPCYFQLHSFPFGHPEVQPSPASPWCWWGTILHRKLTSVTNARPAMKPVFLRVPIAVTTLLETRSSQQKSCMMDMTTSCGAR